MAVFNGTSGNDTLNGTASADTLVGGTGNDVLQGGAGNDVLTTAEQPGTTGSPNVFVPYTGAGGATSLATALFQPSSGINVVSATYTGANKAASFFSSFSYGLGELGAGILLTSGSGTPASSNTSAGYTVSNGTPGDTQLDATIDPVFPGKASFDAAILEIEFTLSDATAKQVSLDMVFGSEEYPEYANNFVDVAAIYVDGVNYAYFNNGLPLSVLTGNFGEIVDNTGNIFPIEYDGISETLKFSGNLADTANGHHTIRIAIADIGDSLLDSGLFISGLSTSSGATGINAVVDDVLDGGVGADSMAAGFGGDTYVVDDVGDIVTEQANQGIDTVQSSISYELGNNVENLTLLGKQNINAKGNSLANVLTGNAGNNLLTGGSGNDSYVFNLGGGQDQIDNFDSSGSSIDKLVFGADITPDDIELRNAPNSSPNDLVIGIKGTTDTVTVLKHFKGDAYQLDLIQFADGTVWDKAFIANMSVVLTGVYNLINGDKNNNSLIGVAGNDSIVGMAGNDTLEGSGGNDILDGGQGDDTYIITNANDIVKEYADSGLLLAQINTTATGVEALGGTSSNVRFSADGTQLLFESLATNLVSDDTNTQSDIFLKNLQSGIVTRVSTNGTGQQATGGNSTNAVFSSDGNSIVFRSEATNLVVNDTNGKADIFVKNLSTGTVTRVSADSTGVQANDNSSSASISADGTKVVFASMATNLVTGDGNTTSDIFLKDVKTGAISRLSTDSTGAESNGNSLAPELSSDGTKVLFVSDSSNLISNDSNSKQDVFIKTISTQEVTRISVNAQGVQANNGSYDAVFSADGTKVLFASDASNLVDGDSNGVRDLFVKDLTTGIVTRVSSNSAGVEGNAASYNGQFSKDGTRVVFVSSASNLVDGDNNGLRDVFIKDLISGTVTRVSTAGNGLQSNGVSGGGVAFSIDGNQVAFESAGNNLVSNDDNGTSDIFLATLAYTNSGTDTVKSSVSYTLSSNIENLELTGVAAINGTGNSLNNQLTGNAGDNILTGGDGNDSLIGGAGNDTAIYSSAWVNYDITGNLSQASVIARTGNEGSDQLQSIETLKFNGITVSLNDALNDAPIGVSDNNNSDAVVEAGSALNADAQATGNVLDNDTDADASLGIGETKLVSAVNGQSTAVGIAVVGSYGQLVLQANGSYLYTLDNSNSATNALSTGQSVNDIFTYTVIDAHGLTGTASLSIHIAGNNDAPTGSASAVLSTGTANSSYHLSGADLRQGFSDAENQALLILNLSADHGSIVANTDDSYTLTPDSNYHGLIHLQYTLQDSQGASIVAQQSVSILSAINHAPIGSASATLATGTEDIAYTLNASDLLQGFSDPDGNPLSVIDLSSTQGQLINNQNGTYTFIAPSNFNGHIGLSYRVSDDNNSSISASQDLQIIAVNDLPTGSASATLAAGSEDSVYLIQSSELLQGFSDVESGTQLTLGQLSASHGSLIDNHDGTYSLTPNANYNGIITLNYQVLDSDGGSLAATQTINISAVNDAPTGSASATLATGTTNSPYLLNASDLLQGFSDIEGQTLHIGQLSVTQGSVIDNGNGTYTLSAPQDYIGVIQLSYQVIDSAGGSIAASQQLEVVSAASHNPTGSATATLAAGSEDTAYLVSTSELVQGFSDSDGKPLTVSGLSSSQGTFIDNQDGSFTFTPNANYNGTVSLQYQVVNSTGGSISANQHLTLSAINDAPTGSATATLAAGTEDTPYIIYASDLLQGFSDIEGNSLSIGQVSSSRGSLVDNQDGSYTLSPEANYNGVLVLNYTVIDGQGGSTAASQRITLAAVNDAPLGSATGSLVSGIENRVYTVSASQLLLGFSDNDNDILSVSQVISNLGSLVDNQDGTYSITPPSNYTGDIQLSYTVIDGQGGSLVASQHYRVISVTQNLVGTTGADVLQGGGGNDTYIVNNAGDSVIELSTSSTSIDTVLASVSYSLGANVENLTLTGSNAINGTGNSLNNTLIGNSANNQLDGGAGDDVLWGGGGVNTLIGGLGNDSYHIENSSDVIIESSTLSYEFDTVYSSVDYTLSANVERLVLEGSANLQGNGNSGNNTLEGNSGNNSLTGGAGDDRLDGGAGVDTLVGGTGDDVYTVDNAQDLVIEQASEGVDVVMSSIDYSLGANVERLFLTGTANINGTGNSVNNYVYGNSGANVLSGGDGNDTLNGQAGNDSLDGGLGNDNLKGGLGDDTYLFGRNSGRDTIDNTDAGNGNDRVLLGSGISADQVWLRQVDNSLEVSIIGTSDRVLISDWYSQPAKRVDSLELSNGQQLLASEVQGLVSAMAAFSPPSLGQTTLSNTQHNALDNLISISW